mmetsp:Transcript_43701/g.70262  ORF Transcript_43701/g.70262 Transcript_43701/m.70262 type:complete len:225 (-) Transcript_43701:1107-1781(-)
MMFFIVARTRTVQLCCRRHAASTWRSMSGGSAVAPLTLKDCTPGQIFSRNTNSTAYPFLPLGVTLASTFAKSPVLRSASRSWERSSLDTSLFRRAFNPPKSSALVGIPGPVGRLVASTDSTTKLPSLRILRTGKSSSSSSSSSRRVQHLALGLRPQCSAADARVHTYPICIMRERYPTDTHTQIHIMGQPILKKLMKLMGYPASAATPAMTTFALEPMSVPIPP